MPVRVRLQNSLILAAALFALAACGPADKEDLLKKAESVHTRVELETALGKPSDIAKLGPLEKWTYKASDGEVVFILTGDTVAMQATGAASKP
jgi:hypothetical protein